MTNWKGADLFEDRAADPGHPARSPCGGCRREDRRARAAPDESPGTRRA
jgi:hypothetical protein